MWSPSKGTKIVGWPSKDSLPSGAAGNTTGNLPIRGAFRRNHLKFAAMGKQYVLHNLSVSVCSHSNAAYKAHVPCYNVTCGLFSCTTFFSVTSKRHDFLKINGRKMCVQLCCVMVLHRTAMYCDGVTWHSCPNVWCYITQLCNMMMLHCTIIL
jgi:hypothetical protein